MLCSRAKSPQSMPMTNGGSMKSIVHNPSADVIGLRSCARAPAMSAPTVAETDTTLDKTMNKTRERSSSVTSAPGLGPVQFLLLEHRGLPLSAPGGDVIEVGLDLANDPSACQVVL